MRKIDFLHKYITKIYALLKKELPNESTEEDFEEKIKKILHIHEEIL